MKDKSKLNEENSEFSIVAHGLIVIAILLQSIHIAEVVNREVSLVL